MFNLKKLLGLEYYTSEIDQFLDEYNKTHKLSASQRQEKEKYAKIFERRDNPTSTAASATDKIWDKF